MQTPPRQGSRTRRCQPKGPQNMCNPAEWSSEAHLQPEPESGEGPCTVEDILPGTCTEEGASQHPQRLQTGGTNVSPDEVPGEAGPVTSSALGQLIIGHLQKFADDSAIVGCVSEGKEEEYRSVVDSFIEWCATNHLLINPTKTKELVVDFRRRKSAPTPISITGVTVDVVQDYKYLGVFLDNKLDWAKNTRLFSRRARVDSIS